MRYTEAQATISNSDMSLADGTFSQEQKTAYSSLLNWQSGQELEVNNRYSIVRYLGRGGFGLVFAAIDQTNNQNLALKIINPSQTLTDRHLRRIKREFELARKLDHPGLVRLHTMEQWHGLHFLTMDLLEGRTLGQFIQSEGPLTWDQLEPMAIELVDILSFLHQNQVIHRDIKPSNIIISHSRRITLLDLGMSRELDDPHKTSSTGELLGSPHYLPPEIIRGLSPSPASDVYQLGLVLFFTITGRHPYDQGDGNTANILGQQLSKPLKIPRGYKMPASTRMLLHSCLSKSPAQRPQSALDLKRLKRASHFPPLLYLPHLRSILGKIAISVFLLAMAGFISWQNLPIKRIEKTDTGDLVGFNILGIKSLRLSTPQSEQNILIDHQIAADKRPVLRALRGPRNRFFSFRADQVQPDDFPLQWLQLNHRGEETARHMLSHLITMNHFDFFPLAMIEGHSPIDIDADGQKEQFIAIRNALSMFPTLFTVWGPEDSPRFTLYSPGASDEKPFLQSLSEHALNPENDIYSFTLSNPYCHYYLWSWNIRSGTAIPPSFNPRHLPQLKSSEIVFLPQNTQLQTNCWAREGWLELISSRNQLRIRFERSGQMTLSLPSGEIRSHQEDFNANAVALDQLNQAFIFLYSGEPQKAAQLLNQVGSDTLHNPWFLSLLEYYRAETAAHLGRIDLAKQHLQKALHHDPLNCDAQNRQCELLLITQGPEKALQHLNQQESYFGQFWGLAYGQDLFRFCCALWGGRFAESTDLMSRLSDQGDENTNARHVPLNGIRELFLREGGDILQAIKLFSSPQTTASALFDISEQQLILARLLMINGNWSRAGAYLQYYYHQTTLHKPFAAISLAWCDIEEGRLQEGVAKAKSGFSRMRSMAVGQFWARFWLFYDAYAYGRAMEKAGLPQEAILGYRNCIEANPHTGLAQDARKRLNKLTRNNPENS